MTFSVTQVPQRINQRPGGWKRMVPSARKAKVDQRAARASRDPLPLSAKLERFTCFCGVILSVPPMEPNTVRLTTCDCGRRWRQHT